jgi:hypothetical protein
MFQKLSDNMARMSKSKMFNIPVQTIVNEISDVLGRVSRYQRNAPSTRDWLKHISIFPGYDAIYVYGNDNIGHFHTCQVCFRCKDAQAQDYYGTIVEASYCDCYGVEGVVDTVFDFLSDKEHSIQKKLVGRW